MSGIELIGCMGSKIETGWSKIFDFDNPTVDQIHIKDIAKALGNVCRFGGHCDQFYSVAEHSYHCFVVARIMAPRGLDFQRAALLHDASEAYTGDMVRPLKNLLPDFRNMENKIEHLIEKKFGVNLFSNHEKLKFIDMALLKAEKNVLFTNSLLTWPMLEDYPDVSPEFGFFLPDKACHVFLNAWQSVSDLEAII